MRPRCLNSPPRSGSKIASSPSSIEIPAAASMFLMWRDEDGVLAGGGQVGRGAHGSIDAHGEARDRPRWGSRSARARARTRRTRARPSRAFGSTHSSARHRPGSRARGTMRRSGAPDCGRPWSGSAAPRSSSGRRSACPPASGRWRRGGVDDIGRRLERLAELHRVELSRRSRERRAPPHPARTTTTSASAERISASRSACATGAGSPRRRVRARGARRPAPSASSAATSPSGRACRRRSGRFRRQPTRLRSTSGSAVHSSPQTRARATRAPVRQPAGADPLPE